jgi:hypothetical protein
VALRSGKSEEATSIADEFILNGCFGISVAAVAELRRASQLLRESRLPLEAKQQDRDYAR